MSLDKINPYIVQITSRARPKFSKTIAYPQRTTFYSWYARSPFLVCLKLIGAKISEADNSFQIVPICEVTRNILEERPRNTGQIGLTRKK